MAVDTTTAPTPPIADAARRAIPAFARGGDRPMLVEGRPVPAASGRTLPQVDPTTEAPLATIPRGAADDVDTAVRAAQRAPPACSGTDPAVRARRLVHIAEVREDHGAERATSDARTRGGPIAATPTPACAARSGRCPPGRAPGPPAGRGSSSGSPRSSRTTARSWRRSTRSRWAGRSR